MAAFPGVMAAFRLWRWTEPGAPGRKLLCEGIGMINSASRGRPVPPASWRFAPLPSHPGEIWHRRAEALQVCPAVTKPRGFGPSACESALFLSNLI